MDKIAKVFARIYNTVPQGLKVLLYSASSTMTVSLLFLFIDDLKALLIKADRYESVFLIFLISIIGGVINNIQKLLTDLGESKLVREGDKTIVDNLEAKVEKTQEILNQ